MLCVSRYQADTRQANQGACKNVATSASTASCKLTEAAEGYVRAASTPTHCAELLLYAFKAVAPTKGPHPMNDMGKVIGHCAFAPCVKVKLQLSKRVIMHR
jgi:hypothetical protein